MSELLMLPEIKPTVEEPQAVVAKGFDFRYSDALGFKRILDVVDVVTSEVTFKAGYDGISIRHMDPSHVCMIDVSLPRTMFYEYHADKTELCFNLEELTKLFGSRIKREDEVGFKYQYSATLPKFSVVLRSKNTRIYQVCSLEPNSEEVPTPRISFKAERTVLVSSLVDALKDCEKLNSYASLTFGSDRDFKVSTIGDLGSVDVDVESEAVLNGLTLCPAKATYTLSYLLPLCEALAKVSDAVKVELSSDMPMRLSVELPNGGSIVYYLAPRIES